MKFNILIIMVLGMIGLVGASPFYYEIQLDYNNGEISIDNIDVVLIQDEFLNIENDYSISILDKNEKVLEKKYFRISNKIISDDFDNPSGSETIKLNNFSFNVYVLHHTGGYRANIYNENNTLLDTEFVSQFSKVFDREDYLGIEKDEIDSKDEKKDIKLISKEKNNTKFYINLLIGTLIVLLILLILIFRKKK